jgi:hypothetical protein
VINGSEQPTIMLFACTVFPETAATSPTAALATQYKNVEMTRRTSGPDQQLCLRDNRSQTQFSGAGTRDDWGGGFFERG